MPNPVPEWQHLALYAVSAAVIITVFQRIPVIGRLVRVAFNLGLLAFLIFVVLQQAPYQPELARLTQSLGLDHQQVAGKELRVRMSTDGHFWALASINGVHRRMLIDSGATVNAVSEQTAREAKIDTGTGLAPVVLRTANGATRAETGSIDELRVGNIVARNLKVVTSPGLGTLDILGMNFLSKLESWRVEGRTLILIPHNPQTPMGLRDIDSASYPNEGGTMVLSNPQADKPGRPAVSLGIAYAALRSGNIVQARQMLQERLAQYPEDADALSMLAEVAAGQRSFEEATMLLRRAVAADPSPDRRMALVEHLRRYASPALAIKELEEVPQAIRNRYDVMGIEAGLRGTLGQHDRQIELYQRIARQRPSEAGIWVSLGNALKTVGRTAEAVKALQRAIKVEPTMGEIWWTLANFKSFRFSQADIKQMRQLLQRGLDDTDALNMHFALGKAYEDAADWAQSFGHYAAGNELRAGTFTDDQRSVTAQVDESIATFTRKFFERVSGAGFSAADPIFVVGLHRSGSTLVEQILASHPLVEGTTELAVMNALRDRIARSAGISWPATIAALDRDRFAPIGEEYIDKTRAFRLTDRPYFVDKMPGNWLNVPLIRAALPNAKIIDARRHPMACGFSNFKQNYAVGVGFSYGQDTIGAFYRDYWRFMRRIDEVQPGAVHRLINERIIDDPEGEVRRLLDYLGLPFDPDCLEFHKTDRAIRTPSAEQVRKPINREGVDYWRHYEPWLDPLKESLGPALEQWDK